MSDFQRGLHAAAECLRQAMALSMAQHQRDAYALGLQRIAVTDLGLLADEIERIADEG